MDSSAEEETKSPCDSDPRHDVPKTDFETFKSSTKFLYADLDPKHGHYVYALCKRCDSTIGFELPPSMPSSSLIW